MSKKPWAVDGQHEAKVKQIYMQPINHGHGAVFAVEFDRPVEIPGKREFGFILSEEQLERLANFINASRAQALIRIPRLVSPGAAGGRR